LIFRRWSVGRGCPLRGHPHPPSLSLRFLTGALRPAPRRRVIAAKRPRAGVGGVSISRRRGTDLSARQASIARTLLLCAYREVHARLKISTREAEGVFPGD